MSDGPIPDDELTALALASAPEPELAPDARSIWELAGTPPDTLLPTWYMPTSPLGVRQVRGWRRTVAYLVVASFLLVAAAGLCTTYGEITRL